MTTKTGKTFNRFKKDVSDNIIDKNKKSFTKNNKLENIIPIKLFFSFISLKAVTIEFVFW